jgi:hypothetical protein
MDDLVARVYGQPAGLRQHESSFGGKGTGDETLSNVPGVFRVVFVIKAMTFMTTHDLTSYQ